MGALTSYVIRLPTYLRFEFYYRIRNTFVYIHITTENMCEHKKEKWSPSISHFYTYSLFYCFSHREWISREDYNLLWPLVYLFSDMNILCTVPSTQYCTCMNMYWVCTVCIRIFTSTVYIHIICMIQMILRLIIFPQTDCTVDILISRVTISFLVMGYGYRILISHTHKFINFDIHFLYVYISHSCIRIACKSCNINKYT